jgi:hypothetical protein
MKPDEKKSYAGGGCGVGTHGSLCVWLPDRHRRLCAGDRQGVRPMIARLIAWLRSWWHREILPVDMRRSDDNPNFYKAVEQAGIIKGNWHESDK